MKSNDWAIFAVSFVALVVSSITAYLTLLVADDDVRFVINKSVNLHIDKLVADTVSTARDTRRREFAVSEQQSLSFMNSGNRPVMIGKASISVVLYDGKGGILPNKCRGPRNQTLDFEVAPFVLRPAEVVVKEMTILANQGVKLENGMKGFIWDSLQPAPGDELTICLTFDAATLDAAYSEIDVVIKKEKLSSEPHGLIYLPDFSAGVYSIIARRSWRW